MSEGTVPPALTASLDQRRLRQRKLLLAFCALSFGMHLGLVAGWLLVPDRKPPAIDLDKAIIKTRLVKLGKPRDDKLLPRLPMSQPPTPKPEKPAPDATKPPSAKDILEKFKEDNPKDVNDIIRERIGKPDDEGQLDGDKDGDALKGEIKATYFHRVAAHIFRHVQNSATLTDDERVRLRAELALKVDSDGNVTDARIQKTSGNTRYDNDVLTAAKRSSPVPAPPPAVRDLAASGFAFNMCPVSCS